MALRALLLSLCFSRFLPRCFSLPLDVLSSDGLDTTTELVVVTAVVTSNVEVLETSTVLLVSASSAQSAPSPPSPESTSEAALPAPSPTSPALALPSSAPSPAPSLPPSTVIDYVTITNTITPPPITVTIENPPVATTEVITTAPLASSAPTSTLSTANQTAWSVPPQITDLSCFNVSEFAYGQNNMQVVQGIPVEASATTVAPLAVASTVPGAADEPPPTAPTWDNSSSVLQLFYPAGSVNPTTQPQGGADFYAAPIDIHNAQNVSLEYSVFFPADFDWVLAGKLPGIYGGHKTCSGGDDALSCFSTRLMWREGGAGELYLYAPKDRQTEALCSTPPMSVCDQTYGLSVGRGSFNFTPGGWTHVKQTVWLNTPGQQDGGFVLEVDGREVINRDDVFYRDVASATPNPDDDSGDDGADDPDYDDPDGDDSDGGSEGDSSGGDDGSSGGSGDDMSPPSDAPDTPDVPPTADPSPAPAPEPSPMPAAPQPSPPSQAPPAPPPAQNPGLGGLLGPLSPLLNGLGSTLPLKRQEAVYIPYAFVGLPASAPPGSAPADIASTQTDTSTATTTPATSTQTVYFQTTSTTTTYVVEATSVSNPVQVLSQDPQPIGFSGLFFSSFFGGHEEEYKTPRDQYTWFKDFAMTVNA